MPKPTETSNQIPLDFDSSGLGELDSSFAALAAMPFPNVVFINDFKRAKRSEPDASDQQKQSALHEILEEAKRLTW